MRGVATIGRAAVLTAGMFAAIGAGVVGWATPAEAGCVRTIINRSNQFASVSRDGGPLVTIPPRASQAIRLQHPGRLDVTLSCAPGGAAVYQNSFSYTAIVDRCYIEFDDGFVRDYMGGGFFGFRDTGPLTLNNPRQGDLIVGPRLNPSCGFSDRSGLRARY